MTQQDPEIAELQAQVSQLSGELNKMRAFGFRARAQSELCMAQNHPPNH